ncbi:MAG: SDR family NAD(P)-dependent oxidoreductase, partial [Gammaproteobacteria bacterium]|nr:SDR family NAD(P)-dependent oxidoreductase [Gammaproteobacteria bacterium]
MNRVDDKVALVTGGGSGIGEATSRLLAKAGARVVVTDRDYDAARQTEEAILQEGGQAIALQHDVIQEDQWQSVVATTLDQFGQLDVLVNNAGVSGAGTGTFEETTLAGWHSVIQVNLDAVFLGTQKAVSVMKEKGGSIVNISSIMGLVGGAGAAYNASKGGVRLLTKSVALYCGQNGYPIRVNSVHPGYVWTPLVRNVLP